MDVFGYENYRQFLKDAIAAQRKVTPTLSYAALAESINVERSYLSHVLHERASLNADQLYQIGIRLGLDEAGVDFLLLLLEIDRCQVEARRRRLCRRRDALRRPKQSSEKHLETAPVVTDGEAFPAYYSDPDYSLVHMLLSIPEYATDPGRLATRLGVSGDKLQRLLGDLERWGLASVHKDGYRLKVPFLHLREGTPLAKMHADSFRLRGMALRQRHADREDYFFTATMAVTEATRQEIKEEFLLFLQRVSKKVEAAPSKDIFHINFDLFRA